MQTSPAILQYLKKNINVFQIKMLITKILCHNSIRVMFVSSENWKSMKTGKEFLQTTIVKLCPGFFHVEKSKDLLIFLLCVFQHKTFSIWEAKR